MMNIVPRMNFIAQIEKSTTKADAWKHFKPAWIRAQYDMPFVLWMPIGEYALTYGLQVSNARDAKFLYERIKELYPQNDMYFSWGKIFFEGIRVVCPSEFLKPEGDIFFTLPIIAEQG